MVKVSVMLKRKPGMSPWWDFIATGRTCTDRWCWECRS